MYVLNAISVCLVIIFVGRRQCYECQFFKNLRVVVTPKSRVSYFQQYVKNNFNGCLSQEQFDQTIVQLAISDEDIAELGNHAVHDMEELKSLSFTGCAIRNVSLRAFENLPQLKAIFIVNCKLTSLFGGIFNDLPMLEDLSLSENQIDSIKPQSFAAMRTLKQVILSRNKLKTIDSLWFSDSPNITLLDFNFNQITKLDKLSFHFNHNLKHLFLDYNEIKSIGKGSFSHFTSLEILSLKHNKLLELSPDVFGERVRIDHLYLSANFLNFLAHDLLKKLSVQMLDLDGNPWKCPCLEVIEKWMIRNNVILKRGLCRGHHIPKCFYDFTGKFCTESNNLNMTQTFLNTLQNLDPPVEEECANFS